MISAETRIFLYIIMNFAVGLYAASGHIDKSNSAILVNQATDTAGILLLAATSLVTLYKVAKHPGGTSSQMTLMQSTQNNGQKTTSIQQEVSGILNGIVSQPETTSQLPEILQHTGLPLSTTN